MYKANQSKAFADCVEFYDDWGTGDNIRLDIYYRMCDELVAEINKNEVLLRLNNRRYNGGLDVDGEKMHPDLNKHILAFDIIYCCTVYDLFDGIPYTRRNAKEKQFYLSEKAKAENLRELYNQAQEEMNLLIDTRASLVSMLACGDELTHKKYGVGIVESVDEDYIVISFKEKEAKLGLAVSFSRGILKSDKVEINDLLETRRDILNRYDSIPRALEMAARALEPYEDYLENRCDNLIINNRCWERGSAGEKCSEKIFVSTERTEGHPLTFYCSQGKYFEPESELGLIWTPLHTHDGRSLYYWDNIMSAREGDIIIHGSDGYIRAISRVKDSYEDAINPFKDWEEDDCVDNGRKLECDYTVLNNPIAIDKYREDNIKYSRVKYAPFDKNGNGNSGYFFDIDPRHASIFVKGILEKNPEVADLEYLQWLINMDNEEVNNYGNV